jgi:enoyl-CoA hydratase/carnithine racemase
MIRVEPRDGINIVHLEHGENRFGNAFVSTFAETLGRLEVEAKPLVIIGSQKFFSNGLDLEGMAEDGPGQMRRLYALFGRIVAFPGATIAAINGHAFGAGTMLAAACDFRVMREDRGYFCFPEVDIGVPMTPELDALLRAKYTTAALCEGWITGKRFSGPEARAVGFVDDVASEADLLPRAVARVAPLAAKSGAVVRALKRMLFASALEQLEGTAATE